MQTRAREICVKSFKLVPSVDRLLDGAVAAIRRFPLVLLCAVVGSVIAVILVEYRTGTDEYHLLNVMVTAVLGIPMFIAFTLIGERQRWSAGRHVAMQGVGIVVLVLYFVSLPSDLFRPLMHAFRLLLLGLGLHFLVAFGPWVGKAEQKGFWQYNKSLLISFLTAAMYSASLFVGLTIALAAADYLFGFDVKEDTYAELWILMAGIANTWIFLALAPRDLEPLCTDDQYPNGIKIFTQYVLLPLVGLYFVILIAYEAKIMVEGNWPKGWVSQLVLWYSVVGVLSLLLLHPLREREGSRWIAKFGDWYFRLLVPLVIMLFLAIRRRIMDYGVTEPRYLVVSLAIGLSIVVLYFVFSRRKDIRIVPIILFCFAIIGAYGPLSASSVSTWSQTSRLETLLIKNGLMKDGALQKPDSAITAEQREKMSGVVAYLNESRGPEAFAGWLADSTIAAASRKLADTVVRNKINEDISASLGFEFIEPRYGMPDDGYFSLRTDQPKYIDISGYERMISLADWQKAVDSNGKTIELGGYSAKIETPPDSSILVLSFTRSDDSATSEIRIDFSDRIRSLYSPVRHRPVPSESLTYERSVADFDVKILISDLSGEMRDSILKLNWIEGEVLIRKRR
jgi:hypothetical protein